MSMSQLALYFIYTGSYEVLFIILVLNINMSLAETVCYVRFNFLSFYTHSK